MKNIKSYEDYEKSINELSTGGMKQYAKELDQAQKSGEISSGKYKRHTQRENDYSCPKCGKGMSSCTCGEKQPEKREEPVLAENIITRFKDFE